MRSLPPEIKWRVHEPGIILYGCRPLVPDHAKDRSTPCRVCSGRIHDVEDMIGDDRPTTVYCGQCSLMADEAEHRLALQRRDASITIEGKARADAERQANERAGDEHSGIKLSEATRRRIWMGYRKAAEGIDLGEPSNLALAGREFLMRIDQCPDWGITLDAKGKVVAADT